MPKQVHDIKKFIEYCREGAKSARIKKNYNKATNTTSIKFKVRCSRHLYTLVLNDEEKADKLKQSLPPGLTINEVPKKA